MKTFERVEETTLSGGTYSITYFFDRDGNPTDKDQAVRFEIQEFDEDGQMIARTYA